MSGPACRSAALSAFSDLICLFVCLFVDSVNDAHYITGEFDSAAMVQGESAVFTHAHTHKRALQPTDTALTRSGALIHAGQQWNKRSWGIKITLLQSFRAGWRPGGVSRWSVIFTTTSKQLRDVEKPARPPPVTGSFRGPSDGWCLVKALGASNMPRHSVCSSRTDKK